MCTFYTTEHQTLTAAYLISSIILPAKIVLRNDFDQSLDHIGLPVFSLMKITVPVRLITLLRLQLTSKPRDTKSL